MESPVSGDPVKGPPLGHQREQAVLERSNRTMANSGCRTALAKQASDLE